MQKIPVQVVTPLIEMFGMCPTTNETMSMDTMYVNILNGLKKGYIVDASGANEYYAAFIDSIDMQYNNTFYKTWSDVIEKDRFSIYIAQMTHYIIATHPFLNCECKPNAYNSETDEPDWTEYTSIASCSFEDLYKQCMSMLTTNVALKSSTVKTLVNYIIEYTKVVNKPVIVDNIKNREAMTLLCDALNILPVDGLKLLSYIVYRTTGETMIVKNRDLRHKIRNNTDVSDIIFRSCKESQLKALASVYNRYKELFIAFKSKSSRTIINKIGRLSKTYHKPMIRGFWETCINMDEDTLANQLPMQCQKASNFKLIQVMQMIRERALMIADENTVNAMYVVRNGKVFIKEYASGQSNFYKMFLIYSKCKEQLLCNLAKKKCTVKFPAGYSLTCPTSEKNFIGDLPMGTSCQLGESSVVGIYWKNEWGTRDFDLSYVDVMGNKIGWDSNWYSGDKHVIYSGDIIDAPNGANELVYFSNDNVPNGIIYVNRYRGVSGSKYRMFFGTECFENINNADMNTYMIDRNKVQLEAEIVQGESAQQFVGVIIDGRFHFYNLSCGNSRVSNALRNIGHNKTVNPDDIVNIYRRKTNSMIALKDVLLEAGFEEVDDNAELDLTQLNRATLLDLFK